MNLLKSISKICGCNDDDICTLSQEEILNGLGAKLPVRATKRRKHKAYKKIVIKIPLDIYSDLKPAIEQSKHKSLTAFYEHHTCKIVYLYRSANK